MKKLLIFFFSLFFFTLATPTLAVTATPSATSEMENKIKTLVQENLSTTEAKLKEKVDLQTLVGHVGKITTIGSNNLSIDSKNTLLQITTTSKTVFSKDGNNIKITSLAIGDKVIVIGTSVKEDIIQAKKIVIIKDEPILVKTTAVVSKIKAVDYKKKNITLDINGTDQILTLSKKSTVNLDELNADQTILAVIKEYEGKLSLSRAKVL